MYWTVASVDVGTKNFAVYVERAVRPDLEAWYASSPSLTSTPAPAPGQCRWKVVWDLSRGAGQRAASCTEVDLTTPLPLGPKPKPGPGPGGHTPAHLHLLWNLGAHAHVWDECHLVLVEKQLNRNPTAIRLETVCRTFFAMRYPAVPCVSYPAKFKTVVLGGPWAARTPSPRGRPGRPAARWRSASSAATGRRPSGSGARGPSATTSPTRCSWSRPGSTSSEREWRAAGCGRAMAPGATTTTTAAAASASPG